MPEPAPGDGCVDMATMTIYTRVTTSENDPSLLSLKKHVAHQAMVQNKFLLPGGALIGKLTHTPHVLTFTTGSSRQDLQFMLHVIDDGPVLLLDKRVLFP